MANDSDDDKEPRVQVPQPKDSLIKRTFGVPEHAAGALKAILPEPLVTAIDWSTLTSEPTHRDERG